MTKPAFSICENKLIRVFVPGGGACWSVVYRCVNKKKLMRKGTFFELGSAQRCHHLG